MAFTKYRNVEDLSPEANDFIEKKSVEGEKTVDEWLEFFTPIAQFDRWTDVQRRNGNYVKALIAFITISGLFMIFLHMFSGSDPSEFILPAIIIVVFGGLQFVVERFFQRYKTYDIPNLLRGFVVPFFKVMKGKTSGDIPVRLNLDLSQISALETVEADTKKTEEMRYMTATANLPGMGPWEMDIDAIGFEQPFYPNFKLRHYVSQHVRFDSSAFKVAEDADHDIIEEREGSIIVNFKYDQQSEAPIEMDSGLDQYTICAKLIGMEKAVQKIA